MGLGMNWFEAVCVFLRERERGGEEEEGGGKLGEGEDWLLEGECGDKENSLYTDRDGVGVYGDDGRQLSLLNAGEILE